MKVEVSIGEAIDKLSILEIKLKKILDEAKKIEVQKEIHCLQECENYKISYDFYYSLLMYVNKKIWDMTDIIKSITPEDSQFSQISNNIFEFNQKRFRIKNWFNLLTDSNIKEQKSYALSHCKIFVDDEESFFNKLAEINFLALEYDIITFDTPITSIISNCLKIPTVVYDEEQKNLLTKPTVIVLSEFSIPENEDKNIFSLKPITYIVGGMFGDFIQSLSVICEKYYETGRKGILYISEKGDIFRNGIENTYNDTYPVIMSQKYIHNFKIYNNEPFEIDLVAWRHNPHLFSQNWYNTYKQTYNVEWGKTKWIDAPYDEKWKDKVIINTTSYRWAYSLEFKKLKELYKDDLFFISSDKASHTFFEETTGISIEYYQFSTFLELVTIINSCKLFAGSLSAPFAIAQALHKERICGLTNCHADSAMNSGFECIFKNIKYTL
jgi:hypothetical protein